MTGASAAAPVRLDFAGGWTDVPPFSAREGGAVLTAAIRLFARAEAAPADHWRLAAGELGADLTLPAWDAPVDDPRLLLHRAALRLHRPAAPIALTTTSDVPPGSGLGSSGALDVALVAALTALEGGESEPLEIARRAFELEAVEAGLPGGKQDQYSAALGGFNLMTFDDPAVHVTSLALDPAFLDELARRTLLCYTGASRLSGNTIARVMGAYEKGNAAVTGALRELRDIAHEMHEALRAADLSGVGTLLTRNWQAQQRLDDRMSTLDMARLEQAMVKAGALGGKAAGSGAGGCMFFLVGGDVIQAGKVAEDLGARLLPVAWEPIGVRAC